ncbi:SNF2 family N-terminal domain-containing protein [Mycotypha africana]|uniref:SNF2 family N-terminal domain-containing protein n=1 Tax=Mycotypha africana TaxID=64632 RepID=UPI00230002AC|nr:SNF2 family N-terminal domain-containing protein [Mycotypha africana]KAI8975685.1 SNF2 family N-terminal domain-containing protein [Mycotypha africana]
MTSPTRPVSEMSDSENALNTTRDSQEYNTAPDSPGNSSLILDLTKEEYDFINDFDDDVNDFENNSYDGTSRTFTKKDKNKQEPGATAENSINLDDDAYAFFVEAGLDNPDELKQLGIDFEEIRQQQEIAKRLEAEQKRDYEVATQLQRQFDIEHQGASSSLNQSSSAIASSSSTPLPSILSAAENDLSNASLKRKMDEDELSDMKKLRLDSQSTSNIIEINDDDDNVIDLTDENDIYAIVSDSDESDEIDYDIVDYLSGDAWNSRPYAFNSLELARRGAAAAVEVEASSGSFHTWNRGTTPTIPNMSGSRVFHPYFNGNVPQSSRMAEMAHLRTMIRSMPKGEQPLNGEDAERELRELLMNVNDDHPPPPEERSGTPDGLSINLLEHQKIGLQWMTKMEESSNKGGILADDMGLGKTIQALALIVSRPCTKATRVDHGIISRKCTEVREDELYIKATLIVCPVSLMDQWRREIESKTEPRLKVLVYHGVNRTKNPYVLSLYDVIISSYAVTAGDFHERCLGPFSKVKFHRVVLDEAHTIKNKATLSARGCYQLDASYRWCMTATPIQNKIEELYSLIKFLRIRPFCEWEEFRDTICKPMKAGNHRKAIKVAHVLMKAISLRRSKKAMIDGRPILDLPERNVHMTHIDFTPDERTHYEYVNNRAQRRFNKYMQAGTVMKNYSSVLVLLLRLRQACLHPHLTVEEGEDPTAETEVNIEDQKKAASTMKPEVVSRLLSESATLSEIECPICMDIAVDAQINKSCGHILCKECLDSYINTNDGGPKRCPQCRGEMSKQNSISVEIFCKVHAPELLKESEDDEEANKAEEAKKEKESLQKVQEYISSAKIDKMLEILEDTNDDSDGQDKTIVFSQFTGFLDLIEQPLKDRGFKFLRYDGSMNIQERASTVTKFYDDPEYRVMLVSTKCGSLGLNLTCANRVILMDIWWNPALENQAIDRVHRIGQQKAVDVHRIFIKDTVEDRILELQKKKQAISDGVLGEGARRPVARLGLREMIYLFRGGDVPDPADG